MGKEIKLNVTKAAKILNIDPWTLRRWTRKGKISCERSPGNHRLFSLNEILSLREKLNRAERSGARLGRELAFLGARGTDHE